MQLRVGAVERVVAFGQLGPLVEIVAVGEVERVAVFVEVLRTFDTRGVVGFEQGAGPRNVVDVDRLDVDIRVLVELLRIEGDRDFRRGTANPGVQRLPGAVDPNQFGFALGFRGRSARTEVARHLVVGRYVVRLPRQRDSPEFLFVVERILIGGIGAQVAHVSGRVDAVAAVGDVAAELGALRRGIGDAAAVDVRNFQFLVREIAVAAEMSVGVVPDDEKIVDGADGIAGRTAGAAQFGGSGRVESRAQRYAALSVARRCDFVVDFVVRATCEAPKDAAQQQSE